MIQYMIKCSTLLITNSEIEEMKKAMEEELRKNQEEIENMKKTWQERLAEQENENKVGSNVCTVVTVLYCTVVNCSVGRKTR